MRGRKRGFDRTRRVADLVQKALAKMLLQDMGDDRFRLVTITGVTMSKDMSYAKVHVSMLFDEPAKIKEIIKDLNDSAKMLRYNLAREVKLRIVPELKFAYDESTAHGFRISDLIDAGIKKEKK
ncbi:MAG TPA: 30S ribosome-binding factor RbfA [Gammaproteobacteria bacterium]|jgi:ribosome-binding factor A|nr:30S ribosome-binding factor RbfA [Gammaproteobacteria bacterium]